MNSSNSITLFYDRAYILMQGHGDMISSVLLRLTQKKWCSYFQAIRKSQTHRIIHFMPFILLKNLLLTENFTEKYLLRTWIWSWTGEVSKYLRNTLKVTVSVFLIALTLLINKSCFFRTETQSSEWRFENQTLPKCQRT